MTGPPAIDIDLLRDELVGSQPPPGRSRLPWLIRRSATMFAAFYLCVFALPALLSGSWHRAFSGAALRIQLLASLLFAATMTALFLRNSRGSMEARLERSAHRLQRDWVRMTQGRWVVRVVLLGIVMAACIGLTVGTLIAIRPPHGELVGGSRVLTVLAFFGMTLAWCIPVAFALRWFYLRWARRFIVAA
jgi:hypothetical protein